MGTISLAAALAGLTGAVDLSGADSVALPNITCGDVDATGDVSGVAVQASGAMTAGTGLTVTTGNAVVTAGDILLTAAPSVIKIANVQMVPSL